METGAITSHIDVAQVVLYAFWAFFAGLIIYLQRESRREGYPLVSEADCTPLDHGSIWVPAPKTFLLADGSTVTVPRAEKDTQPPNLVPMSGVDGFPFVPSGDPMTAGVGPGAYTQRADTPDVTYEGNARIVPLRAAPSYYLEERDADPRGMTVVGADREVAGEVVDVWVDRSDSIARYFEVELPMIAAPRTRPVEGGVDVPAQGPLRVLLPVNFAQISPLHRRITVQAILASQFAGVPTTTYADLVTLNEEDRICAYYGGGYMYATPGRGESWL
jgi:photosynthetic reaction center H subunit